MTNVYMLWDNPASCPPIVKFCLDLWRELNGSGRVHVLNGRQAHELLTQDFPEDVLKNLSIQMKSDLLRLKLLKHNGGVWADATCLPIAPIDSWLLRYKDADFCAPPNEAPGRRFCNWFIYAKKESVIVTEIYRRMIDFFSVPRMPLPSSRFANSLVESNWRSYVTEPVKSAVNVYPYFTFHYIASVAFEEEMQLDELFEKQPAMFHGGYGFLQNNLDRCEEDPEHWKSVIRFVEKSPIEVCKMNWKKPPAYLPMQELRSLIVKRAMG